jgi:hypothetical protein
MAIRIELPSVLFPRLRVRWQTTRMQFARRSRAFFGYALRTVEAPRVWWQSTRRRLKSRWGLRTRDLAKRQAELARFEEKYEDLVDLLCWAAKDGVHTDRDARYTELRAWMCAHYRTIRPRLRSYWVEPHAPTSYDPFEALFASENVDAILNADTGIDDMLQTRAALDCYRGALEVENRSF